MGGSSLEMTLSELRRWLCCSVGQYVESRNEDCVYYISRFIVMLCYLATVDRRVPNSCIRIIFGVFGAQALQGWRLDSHRKTADFGSKKSSFCVCGLLVSVDLDTFRWPFRSLLFNLFEAKGNGLHWWRAEYVRRNGIGETRFHFELYFESESENTKLLEATQLVILKWRLFHLERLCAMLTINIMRRVFGGKGKAKYIMYCTSFEDICTSFEDICHQEVFPA